MTGTDDLGNPVSLVTTTNANGEYSFTGLTPGTYTITEIQQNGWTQTTGGTTVTLTSGQVAVAYSGEEGTPPSGSTEVVTPLLAFGNFHPTAIVIGMDKSPAVPKNATVVNPLTGTASVTITPYSSTFLGGVHVATGDLNGNGYDDIVTAPGRTGAPVINVYDQFGNLLTSFPAYPSSVNGGLNVAVADLTGDGLDDIITVPSWGPAEVRVFMNMGVVGGLPVFSSTPTLDFLAFPSSFIGGATVAASSESDGPRWDAANHRRQQRRHGSHGRGLQRQRHHFDVAAVAGDPRGDFLSLHHGFADVHRRGVTGRRAANFHAGPKHRVAPGPADSRW